MLENNKVVHGQPSAEWTSWKGKDMLLKVDKMYKWFKISLVLVIDHKLKEEGHDQNYWCFFALHFPFVFYFSRIYK